MFWMTVTQSVCSLVYIHFLLTKGNMHLLPFIKMNILKKKCQGSLPQKLASSVAVMPLLKVFSIFAENKLSGTVCRKASTDNALVFWMIILPHPQ